MEGDIITQALEDMARYWNEFKAAVQRLCEQVKRVFEKLSKYFTPPDHLLKSTP